LHLFTDATGTDGYKSPEHTQETTLFSVEQSLFSAGHLPGALLAKVLCLDSFYSAF